MEKLGPQKTLLKILKEQGLTIAEEGFAKHLDEIDDVGHLRKQFYIPRVSELLEEYDWDGGSPLVDALKGICSLGIISS